MPEHDQRPPVQAHLSGVPETLLWNLYHRAQAARGPNPMLIDPKAVELIRRIVYPFERLVELSGHASQWHALRVRTFDHEVRRFLALHPQAAVVALGEGLETQFWRVDNGQVHWLSIDLPETIALRRQLLDDGDRQRSVACSALDERWTLEVDTSHGVLITAQGLLMYFSPSEVDQFLAMCARRLPGATFVFDAVPQWLVSRRGRWTNSDLDGYQPPAWAWGIDARGYKRLAGHPSVATLTVVAPGRGRGFLFGVLLPALQDVRPLRWRLPTFPILRAAFTASPASQ